MTKTEADKLVARLEQRPVLTSDNSNQPGKFNFVSLEYALDFCAHFIASGSFLKEEEYEPDPDLEGPLQDNAIYLATMYDGDIIEQYLGVTSEEVYASVADVIEGSDVLEDSGSAFRTLPEELLDIFSKSQYGQIYQDDALDEDTKTATFTDEYNSDRARDTAPIRELIKTFLFRNFRDR